METNIFLVGTNRMTPIAEACNKNMGGLAFCVPRIWQALCFQYFNPSLRCGPCSFALVNGYFLISISGCADHGGAPEAHSEGLRRRKSPLLVSEMAAPALLPTPQQGCSFPLPSQGVDSLFFILSLISLPDWYGVLRGGKASWIQLDVT